MNNARLLKDIKTEINNQLTEITHLQNQLAISEKKLFRCLKMEHKLKNDMYLKAKQNVSRKLIAR